MHGWVLRFFQYRIWLARRLYGWLGNLHRHRHAGDLSWRHRYPPVAFRERWNQRDHAAGDRIVNAFAIHADNDASSGARNVAEAFLQRAVAVCRDVNARLGHFAP